MKKKLLKGQAVVAGILYNVVLIPVRKIEPNEIFLEIPVYDGLQQ